MTGHIRMIWYRRERDHPQSQIMGGGKNNHNRLYLVMPAYNEAASIGQVLREWMIVLEAEGINWKIVVADSGSTDETHNILKKMCAVCPRLEILSGTGTGHGPKVAALYQYAVRCGADYIFQTDSDGQTRPEEFCRFWKLRHRYRAILGMRPARGDGKSREWVERILCRMLYLYFGIVVPDANAPFRLMEAGLVKKYAGRIPDSYELTNVMMTVYFIYYHEAVTFRTITFRARQGGTNSVNIRKIIKTGWKACRDFYIFRKRMGDQ